MGVSIVDPATNKSVFTFFSEFNPTWRGQSALEATILIIIMICAIAGNSMVLLAVFRNPRMRRTTNFFIANLAISDLLFAALIPFLFTTRITRMWVFGDVICKIVTYIQFISGTCSILTMMMISIERYLHVCSLQNKKLTCKVTIVLIILTWVFAIFFPIPVALAQSERNVLYNDETYIFCGISWNNGFHIHVYLACMVVLFFVIPLIVISWNYVHIFKVVNSSSKRLANTGTNTRVKKQVKLTKMFIAIVCVFVIMWLPFFVLSFLAVYLKQLTSTEFTVTIILASANTCQNPIIYGYFNTKFRNEFKDMCKCCIHTDAESRSIYVIRKNARSDNQTSSSNV